MIECKDVSFKYKKSERTILDKINIEFEPSKFYTVFGPSGSGKSTLLSLLGGLELPTEGKILIDEREYQDIGFTNIRKKYVSYVFQAYHLFPYMTSLENVMVAMDIAGTYKENKKQQAEKLLTQMGLTHQEIIHKVKNLSGGEQQRVCIARALATNAQYILADEPTGNLDKTTANQIAQIFVELAHEQGKSVICMTHADYLKSISDTCFVLSDGVLEKEKV